MIMPLLFLFLRVALVVAAFQLRYSLARFRNLLPPNTASEWLVSAGQVRLCCGPARERKREGGTEAQGGCVGLALGPAEPELCFENESQACFTLGQQFSDVSSYGWCWASCLEC